MNADRSAGRGDDPRSARAHFGTVARLFLSHSSRDSREAVALRAWLIEAEPGLAGEIFLDLDPDTGIPAGVRWKDALRRAGERCEAVICLLSDNWDRSHECKVEYRHAESLNKPIFTVRLEPLTGRDMTSEWQRCDLFGDGPKTAIPVDGDTVEFLTEGLQRLRHGLRAAGIGADTFGWPPPGDPERAPYRGWEPLESIDAAVYFGRDAQIGRAMDTVRGLRGLGGGHLFVVLGPSGVGKSSFVRAGLLPRLARDDRHFRTMDIVRPHRRALTGDAGFARSIHALRVGAGLRRPCLTEIEDGVRDIEQVRGWLVEAQQAARAAVPDSGGDPAPTLILPIDQAEELFGPEAGEQAGVLLTLLGGLLDRERGIAMIAVATIRSDRYEPLQTAPMLASVAVRPFDDLKPMPQAQFKEVIVGPARRAREAGAQLSFAPDLVERLLDDWSRGADTLPLLSLTLARLYRDYGYGEITLAHYETLGGLRRVVQREVDELLDADPEVRGGQLAILRRAFVPWLATISSGTDRPMRRPARWFDLPPESHPLLEEFVARRLLVKDERDGAVVVEVALESLLRQWDALAEWLRVEAADLEAADNIERAAQAWEENGRREEWLLSGSRLTDAESLATTPGFRERLNPVRGLLLASRQAEDERIDEERRHREDELRAARERQQAAETLAATESRAKEDAQRSARALRRRSRILRAALALTMVAALAAGLLWVRADRAQERAVAENRHATVLALSANSQLMLSGRWPGKSDDILGMQMAMAAYRIPTDNKREFALLNAVHQQGKLRKIVSMNQAEVSSVVYSPDGTTIAAAGGGEIQLRDADTWEPIGALMEGHKSEVTRIAFSPDGARLVSAGRDGTVLVWDTGSQQQIGTEMRGHTEAVMAVAFSPDGRRIVSASVDRTVRLWDSDTHQQIHEMTGHTMPVTSVAFGGDGLIASGDFGGSVRFWDPRSGLPSGEPIPVYTAGAVNNLAFDGNGDRLVVAGFDVQQWDTRTRRLIGEPLRGHTAAIESVTYSRDGATIASASDDKTIRLWDASTGQPFGEPLEGHELVVASVAFHPESDRILSGSLDSTVREWVVAGERTMQHGAKVVGADVSPNGRHIVSGGTDGTIRQWDAATGAQVGPVIRGEPGRFQVAEYTAEGAQVASGEFSTESLTMTDVRFWDAATGAAIGPPISLPTATSAYAYDPGRRRLVLKVGGIVQIHDMASMRPIGPELRHDDVSVRTISIDKDGRRVATGAFDYSARLWDADTGKQVGESMTGSSWVKSTSFSPDGHLLAVGYEDKSVRIWDTDTGRQIDKSMWQDGPVVLVQFSPDGNTLVTVGTDNVLRLWDVATHNQIGPALVGHGAPITAVDFTPDGARIMSASVDETIRMWPVPTASPEQLCAKMTHNMSREMWRSWVSSEIDYIELCPGLPIAGEQE
ncbi:TIR domain-containing protein [Nocardia sp. NPDC060249]|uniref:nSTAND1 domain-containing NTPase n=1 Tax=Nocardia sp. NPDC060249 TaxID=3347082 RepID=UPI0036608A7B